MSTPWREPFLTEPGWVDAYLVGNLGPIYRLLTYADGTVRFEHRCDRGERGVVICAPALQIGNGHTLNYTPCEKCQRTHDVPTVTPSILCPDCGTHVVGVRRSQSRAAHARIRSSRQRLPLTPYRMERRCRSLTCPTPTTSPTHAPRSPTAPCPSWQRWR